MDTDRLPTIPDTPPEDASPAVKQCWANETLAALQGFYHQRLDDPATRRAVAEGLAGIVFGSPRVLPEVMQALVSIAYSGHASAERQIARDALVTTGWLQPWDYDLLDSDQVMTIARDLVIYRLGYNPWDTHA